jgi:hypothetical protein
MAKIVWQMMSNARNLHNQESPFIRIFIKFYFVVHPLAQMLRWLK